MFILTSLENMHDFSIAFIIKIFFCSSCIAKNIIGIIIAKGCIFLKR